MKNLAAPIVFRHLRAPSAAFLCVTALLGMEAALPCSTRANGYYWTGTDGYDIGDGANWVGGVVPPSDGTAQVVFSSNNESGNTFAGYPAIYENFYIDSLSFSGNSTFTLGGSNYGLDVGSGGLNQYSRNNQYINVITFLTANQTWNFTSDAGMLSFFGNPNATVIIGGTPSGVVNLQSYTLSLNPGGNNTLGANISGPGSLIVNGMGTLALIGTCTYTGTTTVSAGTLSLASSGSMNVGNVTVTPGGTFALGGGTLAAPSEYVGSASGSGTATFNHSAGSNTVSSTLAVGYAGGTGTYNLSGTGALSCASEIVGDGGIGTFTQSGGTNTIGGSLYLGGSVTLPVSGGGTATYTSYGVYYLEAGVLQAANVALGKNSPAGVFNFNGGTLQAAASTTSFFQGLSSANVQAGGADGNSVGGAIIDTQSFNVTIAQALLHDTTSGAPAMDGGLTKLGAGTLTLTGANTYTGATTVNAGILQAGVASVAGTSGAFGINSAVTLSNVSGATLALNGFNTQIGSLTGGGTTGGNVTLGSATLSVGADSTSPVAYAGVISGTGALTKIGTGTLTLAGTNTYTGGTTVSAGTLVELNNGNALSTGTVGIASGATVTLSNTNTATSVNQAGTITFSGAGTLQKTGAGTISLGGNGGNVNVSLSAGGLIDVEAATLKGSSAYQGIYTNNLGGLYIASGATFDGSEGAIRVNALTGAGTLEGGYMTAGSTTIGVNNGGGTFSGVIMDSGESGGALSLTKVGSGTETLNGANTYTGMTTISAGTLQVGNGSTSGSLGTGSVTDNAALVFNRTGRPNVANTISGSGGLTQIGTGTLTLSGANSYGGGTNVLAGTLVAASDTALGTGNVELAVGTQLTLNAGVVLTNQLASTLTLTSADKSLVDLLGLGIQDTVASLVINGVTELPGTYGAPGSGALFTNEDFRGTGELLVGVGMVPEPSTWALLGVGAAGLGLTLRPRRAARG